MRAGLTHKNGVEPAAAALAPGRRAKFMTPLTKALAVFIQQFGREWAFADARRVGLDDAENEVDGPRPDAGSRRGLPRHDVRRGHERIGAEIDVQKGALRPFKEDALARLALVIQQLPHRLGVRQQLRRDLFQRCDQRVAVHRRHPQPAPQRVMVHQRAIDPRLKRRLVAQIGDADGAAADLVFVGRADAPASRADLGDAVLAFAGAVKFSVDRQDQRGVLRHRQVFGRDFDALRPHRFNFVQQVPRVQDHTVADD